MADNENQIINGWVPCSDASIVARVYPTATRADALFINEVEHNAVRRSCVAALAEAGLTSAALFLQGVVDERDKWIEAQCGGLVDGCIRDEIRENGV